MPLRVRVRILDVTAVGALIRGDHDEVVWRGKPKVRGQVKQRTRVANCFSACAPPLTYRSTPNHQQGSVSRRLESHRCLAWAESQTHNAAGPSGFPISP